MTQNTTTTHQFISEVQTCLATLTDNATFFCGLRYIKVVWAMNTIEAVQFLKNCNESYL